nr:MATE family efflux transporter [Lachnospiraceae bacterium]
MAKLESDLTKGSVWKQMLLFAIPFFISNLIQSLYGIADMMIVSYFGGTESVAGVNTSSSIMIIVTNLATGIAAGGTVMVGQFLGAGQRENIKKSISTLFLTLFGLAMAIAIGLLLFAHPLLRVLNTPAEAYGESYGYLVVSLVGVVFIFGYNAVSAVIRGMGDGKTPLYFVIVACFVNIGLDLLFVAVFHWGATGAAAATVIAQAVSMISCVVYLVRNDFVFDFKWSSYRFDREMFGTLMKVGLPNGVQHAATNLSFLFMTALINDIGGVAANAAVGIVGKFNTFALMLQVAFNTSASAMISQNIGAGQMNRSKKIMQCCLVLCSIMSVLVYSIAYFFPEEILLLFGAKPDVVEQGVIYMSAFRYEYVFVPVIIALNSMFLGNGNGWILLVTNLISSFIVRIPAALYLGITRDMGVYGIGLAVPVASFVGAVAVVLFYYSGWWKKNVVVKTSAEV